ncbi:MAG: hypothetical protein WKG07_27560 [Hymenobacter sp.]
MTKSRVETSRFEVGGLTKQRGPLPGLPVRRPEPLPARRHSAHQHRRAHRRPGKRPPAGLPLKIRLLLPTGKEYSEPAPEAERPTGAFETPLHSAARHHDRPLHAGGADRQRRAADFAPDQRGRIHSRPPEGDRDWPRPPWLKPGPGRDGQHYGPEPVRPARRRPQV